MPNLAKFEFLLQTIDIDIDIFRCNNFEKRGRKEAKSPKKRQKRQIHKKRGTKEARGKKRQKEAAVTITQMIRNAKDKKHKFYWDYDYY